MCANWEPTCRGSVDLEKAFDIVNGHSFLKYRNILLDTEIDLLTLYEQQKTVINIGKARKEAKNK